MSAEARRDVFTAIADPTRRQILGLIANRSMNLNAIADEFEISRPAVSNHIKILTECGMVLIRREGRERYCNANLEILHEVDDWLGQYRSVWLKKFEVLEDYLHKIQAQAIPKSKSKKNRR